MLVKNTRGILTILLLLAVALAAGLWWRATRETDPAFSERPRRNTQRAQRIAYYQGGDYSNYTANLRALIDALGELGWMAPLDIPAFDDPEDAAALWQFLAAQGGSEHLEFVADAFWSAEWDDAARVAVGQAALDRLAHSGDIDVVLAMGTWAGQDLACDAHAVPTIVLSTSDPVQAGIILSVQDSGHDHVVAGIDPDRFRRQIRLFHDVAGFERLGVVYEDSPDGRMYANVADLEQVAGERGFELVRCYARDDGADEALMVNELKNCYCEIAPQIDALWIGLHLGEQPKYMPDILAPMFEHRVPTWAQVGPMAVRRGALLSIQAADFAAWGRWYAAAMGRILNGARPRALSQVFETPGRVVVNLETARRIGFEIPKGILSIADETYESIEGE